MNVAAFFRRHRVAVLLSLLLLAPMLVASSHVRMGGDAGVEMHAGYRVQDLDWVDPARGRAVPVKLFWPDAAHTGKVPLVVFSHGIGSARDGYTYLGHYWAKHGIASLHVQHVGSDRALWQGNPFGLVSRFQHAASEEEAVARVRDQRFALDRVLAGEWGQHVDRARIVAAGHSYGANTTLMSAGARVVRDGKAIQLRDPRFSAAIVISAPPFYGDDDFRPILAGITMPTLHVTTADDIIRIPGFGSGVEDRLKVFDAIGGAHKVLAVYRHGTHNVFTDHRYFDSREVSEQVKQATASLSLAFIDTAYGGSSAELAQWRSGHRALLARYDAR
ncbi:MAG: acetylhydrolase [Xanthomonadaceae bacterium]|nr:acetylhydrolase [Xanthomonadaceae bacterium]